MNLKTLISILLAASCALAAHAAPPKKKPDPKQDEQKKDTSIKFSGEVIKVTASTLAVKTAESEEARPFAFTENTKILNGDKPARLADIKVGNKINGTARPASKSDPILLSVNVGPEKSEEKKPEKPSKKKPS